MLLARTLIFIYSAFYLLQIANAKVIVPVGFEDLTKQQELWVSTSVNGENLGIFKVVYGISELRFSDPEKLLSAIKSKLSESHELDNILKGKLYSPLKIVGNLSCASSSFQSNCDYLMSKDLTLFFDEKKSIAYIILDKRFNGLTGGKRFNTAELSSVNGLIHQQSLYFSHGEDVKSYSLNAQDTIGISDSTYSYADWNWNFQGTTLGTVSNVLLNNLYIRNDINKTKYIQAGLMNGSDIYTNSGGNISMNQLPFSNIKGVRVGTTSSWINKERQSRGTPVSILLTADARVDVHRGEQLLGSFYLKSGFHNLKTDSFPRGSYPVSLKVYENNVLKRVEVVHYVGFDNYLSNDQQWFLQFGRPSRGSADRSDDLVFLGGVRTPINNNLSLTNSSSLTSEEKMFESGIQWSKPLSDLNIDGDAFVSATFLMSDDGDKGNTQQISYTNDYTLSLYRTSLLTEACRANKNFSGCHSNLSLSFSFPYRDWNVSLDYTKAMSKSGDYFVNNPDLDGYYNAPFFYRRGELITKSSKSSTWQLGMSRSFNFSNGVSVSSLLSFYKRNDDSYNGGEDGVNLSINLTYNNKKNNRSTYDTLSLSTQVSKNSGSTSTTNYSSAYNRYFDSYGYNGLGLGISGLNTKSINTSVNGRIDGNYGKASIYLNNYFDKNNNSKNYNVSGSYSSSVVIDKDSIAFGRWGGVKPASAILLKTDSEDYGRFGGYAYLDTGDRLLLGKSKTSVLLMPGYHKSNLRFSGVSNNSNVSTELKKGTDSKTLFMTPGKVYTRDITIESFYTWFGLLLDSEGLPILNAEIVNSQNAQNYGNGAFMWETKKEINSISIISEGKVFHCDIHQNTLRGNINYIGDVMCKS